jgi:hypothetical protein
MDNDNEFEHDGCCDDCGTDLLYNREMMYFDPEFKGNVFCEKCVNEYQHTPSHGMKWVHGVLSVTKF